MPVCALWQTGVPGGPLILAGMLLVVGGIASLAAYPPAAVSLPTRIATVFALGYSTVGMTSAALVIVHRLSPVALLLLMFLIVTGLTATTIRRGVRREHIGLIRVEWNANRAPLTAGLLVLVAAAVSQGGAVLEFGPSSAWRYWADGVQIGDLGRVPAQSPHWGVMFPTTVSKSVMNAFDAGASYLVGSDLTVGVGVLASMSVIGCTAALWAVGHELGLRQTAPLFALVCASGASLPGGVVLNREFAHDFREFKAENFGRMVAFCVLALAIRAVRERRGMLDAAVVGFLGATSGATHLIPTVVAIGLLAGVVVGTSVQGRSPRISFRTVAVGIGTFVAVLVSVVGLAGGDLGFQGAGGSYQPFHVAAQSRGLDPTAAFVHRLEAFPSPSRRWELGPRMILTDELRQATGLIAPASVAVAAAAVAAGLVMALRRERRLVAVSSAFALAAMITVGALLFSYRYHTLVPGSTGAKRLFDYAGLPLTLIACCLLETALDDVRGRVPRAAGWAPIGLPLVVLVFFLSPSASSRPDAYAVAKVKRDMSSVRANTPCGARVLLNFRTTGSVELLARRVAILEGMAPYLRPTLLTPTLKTIYGARAFFSHPQSHVRYLTDRHVNYIVVLSGPAIRAATGEPGLPVDGAALSALPVVRTVFQSDGIVILRVLSVPTRATVRLPGYGC
jgi:hypothetical protein